ncbi:rhamnulokinase [Micromonospora sp. CPCC 206061]|uniref:rhamnulokinase n=1 Tax=Micromonospora sp. CPCC 206061 TaxID=3122410 RepID=UPI002FF400A6
MPDYLAVDLGAESGRVVRGTFDGGHLTVEEIHRFVNQPMTLRDGLHWDVSTLFAELSAGLAAAAGVAGRGRAASVGIDTWGNDFALLGPDGALVCDPWHHRDRRTDGVTARILARAEGAELYRTTGTPPLPINTATQLVAMEGSALLDEADRLALLPDLFAYWLTGEHATDQTIASTSQLMDVSARRWSLDVIKQLGVPARLFQGEVVPPGTPVGQVLASGVAGAALPGVPVIAVAGHDTASAVAAVPAAGAFGYVSSGTWSLVGLELPEPVLTDEARRAGFSNEAGVGGTVRFLRNGTGLWLLQRCRAAWRRTAPLSYSELTSAAGREPGFRTLFDPDDPTFLWEGDVPARIAEICAATGQPVPVDPAGTARCILDSLACRYRWTLERAEALSGHAAEVVHIVGGGAANTVLCQLTADVMGRPVFAGPVEATAIGNILVQAWTARELGSLADLRAVVRRSMPPRIYEPRRDRGEFEAAYARFVALL